MYVVDLGSALEIHGLISSVLGAMTARTKGSDVTCVYCRARWVSAAIASSSSRSGGVQMSEGYLNLGNVAGLSPVRDTSSCKFCLATEMEDTLTDGVLIADYHGPRRGRAYYGYQCYE